MPKELKVNAEELAEEVTWLSKMPTIGPETAVIEITGLLSALMLRRISGDQYRESVISAVGVDQTRILVGTTKLLTALKSMSGPVIITIDEQTLAIESDERRVELRSADGVVEFPQWPQFTGQGKEMVTSREMAQVLTSVSTDDALPALTTIAFDNGVMVSTDRRRLSAISYDESGFTGRVPSAALRAFAKNDTAVFVEAGLVGDNEWVQLRSGRRSITTPMADVEFPRWKQLIPEDPTLEVAVARQALLKAITGEEVTLTVDGDMVTVTSESDGVRTKQKVKLFQTVKGSGPFSVTILSKYAIEALRGLNSGLTLFKATAPDKPVVFQDISERDIHLVMPIKKEAEEAS